MNRLMVVVLAVLPASQLQARTFSPSNCSRAAVVTASYCVLVMVEPSSLIAASMCA